MAKERLQRIKSEPDAPKAISVSDWLPSSPIRNPVANLYVNNGPKLLCTGYCGLFACRKAVEYLIDGRDYVLSGNTIRIEGAELTIRSEQMSAILGHDYTQAQKAWDLPEQETAMMRAVMSSSVAPVASEAHEEGDEPAMTAPVAARLAAPKAVAAAPKEGSRKAQIYAAVHAEGEAAAFKLAETLGLSANSVKSWLAVWGFKKRK